ncbi:MAG: phage tail tip lysozyme [Candidatus Saccharibacteria bacterium]
MRKRLFVIVCLIVFILSAIIPLRVLAIDTGFYSESDILFYSPDAVDCIDASQSSQTTIKRSADFYENAKSIATFFTKKGLSLSVAAGIVGNFNQESGLNPAKIQGGAIAPDDYKPVNKKGFGLAQWTFTSRQAPLVALGESTGRKITDLGLQLDYVWKEMTSGSYNAMMQQLKAIKDEDNFGSASAPMAAAIIFHGWTKHIGTNQKIQDVNFKKRGFEGSRDTGDFIVKVRGGTAEEVYKKLDGKVTSGSNTTDPGTAKIDGKNITIIGDSVTVGSKDKILDKLPGAAINAEVGRQFKTGLDIAKTTTLRNTVVFALGTNSAGLQSKDIKTLVDTVGVNKTIVLVTNYGAPGSGKNYTSNNNVIKKAAQEYPNILVADWASVASADFNKYISSDHIHPTIEGRQLFADTVYNVLNKDAGVSYPSPSTCGGNNDIVNSVVAGDIVQTAKNLALPTRVEDGKFHEEDASPAYIAARQQYNPGTYFLRGIDRAYSDCGRFVSTVIRSSGADPNYPIVSASAQLAYAKKNTDKFLLIPHAKFEDLKPGDILIISGTVVPKGKTDREIVGHTLLFTGDKDNPITEAALSRTDNSGRVPSVQSRGYLDWTLNRDATAIRIIKK